MENMKQTSSEQHDPDRHMNGTSAKNTVTICFTGDKPKDLCGYDIENYKLFTKQFVEKLSSIAENILKHDDTEIRWISGGAQGFQQMAFWTVDIIKQKHPEWNMKMKNIVYQPFPNQPDRWHEGLFGPTQYKNMLQCADEIKCLTEENPNDYNAMSDAMTRQNHQMVNDSDYVIALYPADNWNTAMRSNTCECMRYACENRKDIMQIKYTTGGNKLSISATKILSNTGGNDMKNLLYAYGTAQETIKYATA